MTMDRRSFIRAAIAGICGLQTTVPISAAGIALAVPKDFSNLLVVHPAGVWTDPETGEQIPYRDIALKVGKMIQNGSIVAVSGPSWSYVPSSRPEVLINPE